MSAMTMAEHALIPELDRKGLRSFGLTTGAIVAGLFGLFFPWLLELRWPLWPWIIFLVLASMALLVPLWLRPIYRGWMRFGLLLSKITTPLILGIVFFLVIAPMGLLRRLVGGDKMARQFSDQSSSYRVNSERRSAKSLERPF